MKQPPLHLVLKYHFNNWGKGFLRLGLFMIVCFIFSGCQDFHQAKGSTKWMEKDSTEKQVLKSLSYLKLNSNKHKTFSGAAPELLKKYIVELNTIKNKYPELSEKILSGKADPERIIPAEVVVEVTVQHPLQCMGKAQNYQALRLVC
jgi:hypothetical protein